MPNEEVIHKPTAEGPGDVPGERYFCVHCQDADVQRSDADLCCLTCGVDLVALADLREVLSRAGLALVPAAGVAEDSEEDPESLIEQLDEALCSLLHRGDEVGDHSPRTHLDLFYASTRCPECVMSVQHKLQCSRRGAPLPAGDVQPISDETLRHLRECALSWEPEARLLGNVTAHQLRSFCLELARLRREAPTQEDRAVLDGMARVSWRALHNPRTYGDDLGEACEGELARRSAQREAYLQRQGFEPLSEEQRADNRAAQDLDHAAKGAGNG